MPIAKEASITEINFVRRSLLNAISAKDNTLTTHITETRVRTRSWPTKRAINILAIKEGAMSAISTMAFGRLELLTMSCADERYTYLTWLIQNIRSNYKWYGCRLDC